MSSGAAKYRVMLCLLLGALFFTGSSARGADEEVIALRLVTMIDQDDQGESIAYPTALYYDYWSSETYLISSTGRITIYDQKFFPVASFGRGRGLENPRGLTVDRRGDIYVCQFGPKDRGWEPRLTIYNQAFFPAREIIFAEIPELAGFAADKVAVAESGKIYLTGEFAQELLGGVAVLSPEGKFIKILRPPDKGAFRPGKKVPRGADGGGAKAKAKAAAPVGTDSEVESEVAAALPAGLKPAASARARDDDDDQGFMDSAYISDVKIDRQGRIYLLSREVSQIYVFDAQEKFLFKFGEKGGVAGKLSNPISVCVDLERRVIYVADYMRHTVLCYDYDSGKFIFEFGGRGLGPLWFNFPNSIEVDRHGQVVVADLFNRRLQVIDPNMSVRRPLAVEVGGPEAGAEAPPAVEPAASVGPEAVVQPAPPASLEVADSAPPAPPLPSIPALVATTLGNLLPVGGVTVPRPPAPLALNLPARPRELAPARLKKAPAPRAPNQPPVTVAAPPSPLLFPSPAAVRLGEARGAAVGPAPVPGILARFRALPPAVGVYGPVAALLGVGSWLLFTKR